jgi:hypothetical protein
MMTVVHIVGLGVLFFWLWKKFPQPIFSIALILKMACGIGLGLLYKYYYTAGDTWTFFQDAVKATDMLRAHPNELINFFWFNEWSMTSQPMSTSGLNPMFMIKWVTFLNLLTDNNYWLVATYLSLFSFGLTWILFESVKACFPNQKAEAAIAILFVPSVIFWSSGVIKESLALGALLGLSGFFIRWHEQSNWSWHSAIGALLTIWILWNLKYYWLAVWLAVVIPLIAVKVISNRSAWVKSYAIFCWLFLFMMAVIGVSILHPNFYYYRFLTVIVDNYHAYTHLSTPGDAIVYFNLEPTLFSMAKNAPWALMSGFFRPFFWEASTAFQLLAALENFVLLGLFLLAVIRFKKWFVGFSPLHLALFFYLILLAALLALSTPNFGSLSRYRIAFAPFLWLVMLVTSGVVRYLPKSIQNLLNASL